MVCTGTVPHEELPAHIAAMDAAVVLAEPEADFHYSPLKLAEYLACGVAVVAPRAGAIPAQLADGTEALLVEPGDVAQLTRSLVRLRDRPEERATPRAARSSRGGLTLVLGSLGRAAGQRTRATRNHRAPQSVGCRSSRYQHFRSRQHRDSMSASSIRMPSVYEPTESGLPPMRRYILDLRKRRRFIWHLARTDLKAKNYGTVIGQSWIILDPLLSAGVYYFFRTVVKSGGTSAAARSLILSHLIWGVFFFTFTNNSMRYGAQSLISGRGLVLNASFPRAVLPLVAIVKAMLDFLPTLAIYGVFHALLGQPFALSLLSLPILIALLTVFNMGVIFIMAVANVFFRDTANFLPYLNRLWLYMTPVLYSTTELPPNVKVYLQWNPLYPFFAALEQIFRGQFPSSGYLLAATAWAIGFFLFGAILFLAKERDFAVRL